MFVGRHGVSLFETRLWVLKPYREVPKLVNGFARSVVAATGPVREWRALRTVDATMDGGTVGKALDVLEHVARFGRPVRFMELQAASPFPKATLWRFLRTLCGRGMLSFDPERRTYQLGMRLVRLAHTAWEQSSLAPVARPHLESLSRAVRETVHLAQLDSAHVLYIDKIGMESPVAMYSEAGKIGPAYCTGVGKVMLAYLEEPVLSEMLAQQSFHRFTDTTIVTERGLRDELTGIRASGYAVDREEHERGIVCVAAPILSPGRSVLGGLSVTGATNRTSLDALLALTPQLREASEAIAGEAATWRFPEESAVRSSARERT